MLADVKRVLEPGGWFCVDTPNLRATELMLGPGELSNPDHKLEYTHAQLTDLFRESGFEIVGAYGLGHLGDQLARGQYDDAEVAAPPRRVRRRRELPAARVRLPDLEPVRVCGASSAGAALSATRVRAVRGTRRSG